MIKIERKSKHAIKVIFTKTTSSGKQIEGFIEARLKSIALSADLQIQDIPEFIEAVKLAEMIANGKVAIK